MLSSVDKKLKSSVLIVKHKTDSKQICTSLFFCVFEHINNKKTFPFIRLKCCKKFYLRKYNKHEWMDVNGSKKESHKPAVKFTLKN